METYRFVGIDGCPDGWFCVGLDADAGWRIDMIAAEAIAGFLATATVAFIDIPIGLKDTGGTERACDRQARLALGRPRGSSVFPAPARASLCARDFSEALMINRRQTGRGISKQSWMIAPKIRLVDEALQADIALRSVLHESHPEVCFWALNGATAMLHNKKTVSGRNERIALLRRFFPAADALHAEALQRYRRRQVAVDDVLDAMVLAISARLGRSAYRTLPENPPCDSTGLAMQIVFSVPPSLEVPVKHLYRRE
jgi:predicted RNase H-like nuclease